MSAYDHAFPAVDATTVTSLSGQSTMSETDINAIQAQIVRSGTNDLIQGINSSEGSSQNALTYGMYINRNNTIANIADDMTAQNNKLKNGPARDTYTRQGEINEWQAQNKLDTLFFLQSLFIFLVILVILVFLRQYGLLVGSAFYVVVGLFLAILVGIMWNRASYTLYSRDKRYWNRRFIGLNDSGLQAKLQCSSS